MRCSERITSDARLAGDREEHEPERASAQQHGRRSAALVAPKVR